MLLTLIMRRKSRKGFHKMASRNVSNKFTVAGKSVSLHKGTIFKEMQPKCLYFSEIKRFQEDFKATTYLSQGLLCCQSNLLMKGYQRFFPWG